MYQKFDAVMSKCPIEQHQHSPILPNSLSLSPHLMPHHDDHLQSLADALYLSLADSAVWKSVAYPQQHVILKLRWHHLQLQMAFSADLLPKFLSSLQAADRCKCEKEVHWL